MNFFLGGDTIQPVTRLCVCVGIYKMYNFDTCIDLTNTLVVFLNF